MNALILRRHLLVCVLALGAAASVGCDSIGESAGSPDPGSSPPNPPIPPDEGPSRDAAQRAIAEADIVQRVGGRLYAMSRLGSVAVVDISAPSRLTLLGKIRLGGEPFEMYLQGNRIVAMVNGVYMYDGKPVAANLDSSYHPRSANSGAGVVMIDVSDPAHLRVADTFPVPGEIADSRMVGNVLYLVTYDNAQCWHCGTTPRTWLTSFDLSDRASLRSIDQLGFAGGPAGGLDRFTFLPWKRSIAVTLDRLYIGGMADSPYPNYPDGLGSGEGILEVVDVRDPGGRLVRGASLPIAGPILSRWQVDERGGVLRVVSQRGAGSTRSGTGMPLIETFKVEGADTFTWLGRTTLRLPEQEGLRAVRFDDARAYAITFKNTDPLYVIDLSDPSKPKQRGELHMPGFLFHMEPRGNQLLGLGVDTTDPRGDLNVSLVDVHDPDRPALVQRVSFGSRTFESASVTRSVLPEDQDRIQKAFRIISSGQSTDLVVVPFAAPATWYSGESTCASGSGGVQLVDWSHTSTIPLTERAMLQVRGRPRRAFVNSSELLTVSDSNVTAFSLSNRDEAVQTANLEIEECQPYVSHYANDTYNGHGGVACCGFSIAPGGMTSNTHRWWSYGLVAALGVFWSTRRRKID